VEIKRKAEKLHILFLQGGGTSKKSRQGPQPEEQKCSASKELLGNRRPERVLLLKKPGSVAKRSVERGDKKNMFQSIKTNLRELSPEGDGSHHELKSIREGDSKTTTKQRPSARK